MSESLVLIAVVRGAMPRPVRRREKHGPLIEHTRQARSSRSQPLTPNPHDDGVGSLLASYGSVKVGLKDGSLALYLLHII